MGIALITLIDASRREAAWIVRVALVVLGISSPVFAQEDATEGILPVPNYSGSSGRPARFFPATGVDCAPSGQTRG